MRRGKDVYEIEADLTAVTPALEGYSVAVVCIKHGLGPYPEELTNVPKTLRSSVIPRTNSLPG